MEERSVLKQYHTILSDLLQNPQVRLIDRQLPRVIDIAADDHVCVANFDVVPATETADVPTLQRLLNGLVPYTPKDRQEFAIEDDLMLTGWLRFLEPIASRTSETTDVTLFQDPLLVSLIGIREKKITRSVTYDYCLQTRVALFPSEQVLRDVTRLCEQRMLPSRYHVPLSMLPGIKPSAYLM